MGGEVYNSPVTWGLFQSSLGEKVEVLGFSAPQTPLLPPTAMLSSQTIKRPLLETHGFSLPLAAHT